MDVQRLMSLFRHAPILDFQVSAAVPGNQYWTVPRPSLARFAFVLAAALAISPFAAAQQPTSGDRPVAYTVLLESRSVGERLREDETKAASAAPRRDASSLPSLRRAVARSQDTVRDAIRSLDATVIGSASNVLNAIFVRATPEQAAQIGTLQGVADVVRSRPSEPMLGSVGEIVGVDSARMRPIGSPLFGDGLKVAIIDSGLDFDHEAFQDASLARLPGYPKGDPEHLAYASAKVIAVRTYVEMLNSRDPDSSSPDDDTPRDIAGHGTAVAMIAAGKEVETPLGPMGGIAPKARIGVYKVFGTPGVNFYTADQAVIAAIDDAVSDGMDILNLSLGHFSFWPWDSSGRDCSRRLASSSCDPLAAAAQSAATDFGKVVVVAAGNSGFRGSIPSPSLNTLNSPGNAPAVITVGGIGNSVERFQGLVTVGERPFEALGGTGPSVAGPLTAPAVLAAEYGVANGCEPYPAGSLSGKIVVIERGQCFFVQKVEHADAAGAAGAVVINHFDNELVRMALLEDTDIPAFFVGREDGAELLRLLPAASHVLTLDPAPVTVAREWDYVYPSSSRGPTLRLQPKPDLAAPADSVYTATPRYNDQGNLFAPSGFNQISGTSFAAPTVAGAAALVWEAFPALTGREIASALINTARSAVYVGSEEEGNRELARLRDVGAGVLDIGAALRPGATATPASVGFGEVGKARLPIRRNLVIRNKSNRPQSFRVTVEPRDTDSLGRIRARTRLRGLLRLGAGSIGNLEIVLEGARPRPGSYEGSVRLESLSGQGEIRIPYLYVVGDNEPFDSLRLSGRDEIGIRGENQVRSLTARVTDQFGAPVAGREVQFQVTRGPGEIVHTNPVSGPNGLIHARVRYGTGSAPQRAVAEIGDLEILFDFESTGERPEVLEISNWASEYSPRGVAAGGLVRISGRRFATYPSGGSTPRQQSQLVMTRKGVSVAFDAPSIGVSEPGRILDVGEDWVTVQVPWELAGASDPTVKVRAGNQSLPFGVDLVRENPGIFSYERDGTAIAAATLPDGSSVSLDAPAQRGTAVTLFMTGNGPVRNPPPSGEAPRFFTPTVYTPIIRIGGLPAPVRQSGLMPGAAGMYLVTFVVPTALQPGTHPVKVDFNYASSNAALLPVR